MDKKIDTDKQEEFSRVLFIRHLIRCTTQTLQSMYDRRYFVLDYQPFGPDPALYSETSAVNAIKRLNAFCKSGGWIAADYKDLRNGKILVGKVLPNTKVEMLDYENYKGYKGVLIVDAKEISLMDYPVLQSLMPRLGGILTDYSKAKTALIAAYTDQPLPTAVYSLSTEQLETLCYEYMRINGLIDHLLLPIGRTLRDVDIIGIDSEGNTIAAQVTFETSAVELNRKSLALTQFGNSKYSSKFIFFSETPPTELATSGKFISITEVFDFFLIKRHPLLTRMLNGVARPNV